MSHSRSQERRYHHHPYSPSRPSNRHHEYRYSHRQQNWWSKIYSPIMAGSIDGTDTTPHDHAIQRAMNANYDASKDPKIIGRPECTLFVARLSDQTTEETLRRVFEKFGKIVRLRLVRDIVTGESKRYAFIEYKHRRDFRDAYEACDCLVIDGKRVLVDFERERRMKGWVPRRFGGGLGGRKESGQLRFGGRDRPFKVPFKDSQIPKDIICKSNYIFDDHHHKREDERRRKRRRDYSY